MLLPVSSCVRALVVDFWSAKLASNKEESSSFSVGSSLPSCPLGLLHPCWWVFCLRRLWRPSMPMVKRDSSCTNSADTSGCEGSA
jgi:hypothetical protein